MNVISHEVMSTDGSYKEINYMWGSVVSEVMST